MIEPIYYRECSEIGKRILDNSDFPHTDLFSTECYVIIEKLGFDFNLGNCFKYLWRCGEKNFLGFGKKYFAKKDLKKSYWYICRYLNKNYVNQEIEPPLYWIEKLTENLYMEINQ
jgi:hypothetical protein